MMMMMMMIKLELEYSDGLKLHSGNGTE